MSCQDCRTHKHRANCASMQLKELQEKYAFLGGDEAFEKKASRLIGDSEFRRTRPVVVKRSGGICEKCKAEPGCHVHHKDRNRRNNSPENLIHLCIRCHQSEHRHNIIGS